MKSIKLPSLKSLGPLLSRFQVTLFIVFIAAGLGAAVMTLNALLNDSSTADGYTSPIDAGTIDQATLDRIKALHTSKETVPKFNPPAGRINPFAE